MLTRPLTIEDRVEMSIVTVRVRIERDQVDEFAQEIQGLMHTLHGTVVDMHADPAHQAKGARP